MCGIAGWVDFSRDLTRHTATAEAMTATMSRRGPDDEGLWQDRHVLLGHRRLSVIDLEGGHQPMAAEEDGRTLAALTFCGEIYNYRELRAELISYGHEFRTRSDTEVALRAYLQWGDGFAQRLNGMFAMGVWDVRAQELLLVRDRLGVKPLYYHPIGGGLLFGSEPKAILAHPGVPRRVGLDGMREFLDMVKTPERAVFSGMHEVRPGHLVRLRRSGLTKHRYWAIEAREHTDAPDTTVATVRGLLEDIVGRQLLADVPVCTLLSGGLDSSALTALAADRLSAAGTGPVRSFSVAFTGAEDDFRPDAVRGAPDRPFAAALAAHVGAEHTEVLLNSAELVADPVRAAVLRANDQPPAFWGDMWPSLFLLCRAIRERSTVALSGEGADELFGGYRWFFNQAAVHAGTFPWLTPGSARYFGGLGLLADELKDKLDLQTNRLARYHEALAEVPVLPGEDALERRMREVTYLNLTRFLQTLLDRKDRMSMASSLEVRVPFLDHRLIEYVFNVPWAMKVFDGREKGLLRAAVGDLLPEAVRDRVKTPYPATQDPAYEQALRDELGELTDGGERPIAGLLDPERVKQAVRRPTGHVSRPYDRGSLEMALWMTRWFSEYDVTLDY
ncbi:asparagine synthase (glutamine-hydrolyzing) [Spongiactinospora gelatinilytica]|uniref:asparagine synthase (glutamine-hydrolyzing) n=1 Tax=Spongiactinospora gelatinilytica TaxID=2666298 RepID=A0A2W2HNN8_9ACTN|nr:asparagine synthase (glutamine-hydrolyzing) [Spongiactinospora gelatinilytica]PZG51378.1 asparagine synthase (glutamine-hydrolyzing) [Spongiactinospora gelatinilytica]